MPESKDTAVGYSSAHPFIIEFSSRSNTSEHQYPPMLFMTLREANAVRIVLLWNSNLFQEEFRSRTFVRVDYGASRV